MNKLSFVVPCYNSEKTIKIVVEEIISLVYHKYSYEIILVNDNSNDKTFDVIKGLCAKNDNIIGINLSKNFGQHSAILAGFSVVSGDIVIYSDDDGQTPLDEMFKLINELELGYDIVFAKFRQKKNSIIQNFGTRLNNLMSTYLMDKPKNLHLGNFWASKRFIIDESVKSKNPNPYLAGIFLSITKKIGVVPTNHRERIIGKSNYTIMKMLNLWLNGFTAYSVKPLRLASILGVIFSISGFIYLCFIVFNKYRYPSIPMGYSSIMVVLLFIGGGILTTLGIIGEYIARIYMNINNVPQYIIKERIN